jgi:hypothetical protein
MWSGPWWDTDLPRRGAVDRNQRTEILSAIPIAFGGR